MRLLYCLPPGGGWHPVTHMVRLLGELLEAQVVTLPVSRPATAWRTLASLGPRRRGAETCLVVAAEPRHLNAVVHGDYWRSGYRQTAGWVIDSFWIDRIPAAARHRDHFDQLFVADKEVVRLWEDATHVPVRWLPWGSDVLRLGSGSGDRPVDVQRLGRQPQGWEDDEETRRACEAAGLRFEGRPAMRDDATANQTALMGRLARAKFVLAFSNAVSPAPYTHPTRDYLTGRWTDSLASGAVVAGIAPKAAAARELLWPNATLELSTTEPAAGIEQIVAAARSWDPELARDNHLAALRRLDWRWRFQELAGALGVQSEKLEKELELLAAAIG
jgi:hypothetical protein